MDYHKLTKPYLKPLIKDIKTFCHIPSFYDVDTISKKTPYGKAVDEALEEFKKFGQKHGFKTVRTKDYVELTVGDKGPTYGVFGHLDVVKITSNRYEAVLKKDRLLGRGVADDKGPLLAAAYAVIALKEKGLIKNARVKVFAGGAEEIGSPCLNKYMKTHPAVKYGFTPDSYFPATYGEKGLVTAFLSKKVKLKNIEEINAGKATNVVAGEAEFKVNNINQIKNKIKTKHFIKGNKITFIGKTVHGSVPKLGKNAFMCGLKELGELNHDKEAIKIATYFMDTNGKKIGGYYKGELGEITYNIGIAKYHNGVLTFSLEIRHPETADGRQLVRNASKVTGFKVDKMFYENCLLYDCQSPLIKLLYEAYQKEWNDYKSKPVISGGGTYAKHTPNIVAFGPTLANKSNLEHSDGEFIKISELKNLLAAYAHALDNFIHSK